MSITRLTINNFRNITEHTLHPCNGFNVIHGINGSGKTSLLEAIYTLSTGKSFKSKDITQLIQHKKKQFSVFGEYSVDNLSNSIGIVKHINNIRKIQINNEKCKSIVSLAKLLPVQIITTDSHKIFHDGPKYRREFLDRGVFHVNPKFITHWKNYQKALKQRNAALKMKAGKNEIIYWDNTIIKEGNEITSLRKAYLSELNPIINKLSTELLTNIPEITIKIFQGWSRDVSLEDALRKNILNDCRYGFTREGPHRSDVIIKTSNGSLVKDFLSQGQQKILAYCLNISQSILLKEMKKRESVYLIDDLPSELDHISINNVMNILKTTNSQLFITSIDEKNLTDILSNHEVKLFHMKRG